MTFGRQPWRRQLLAIEFSLAAEEDLLGIFLYGIREHGLAQAEFYKNQLEQAFQIISDNPKVARLRQEISPAVRVYPAQRHLIIYMVLDDTHTAYVLRIRHHSENWTQRPTK